MKNSITISKIKVIYLCLLIVIIWRAEVNFSYCGELDDIVWLNIIPVKSDVSTIKEKFYSRKGSYVKFNQYKFDSKGQIKTIDTYNAEGMLLETIEFRMLNELKIGGIKYDGKKSVVDIIVLYLNKNNKIIERLIHDDKKAVKTKILYRYDDSSGKLSESIYLNNSMEIIKKFVLKNDIKSQKYINGEFYNALFELRQEWLFENREGGINEITVKNINDGAQSKYRIKYNSLNEALSVGFLDGGAWKDYIVYEYIKDESKKSLRVTEYEKIKSNEKKDLKHGENISGADSELTETIDAHVSSSGGTGFNYNKLKNDILNAKGKLKNKKISLLEEVCRIQEMLIKSGFNDEKMQNAYSYFKAVADARKISPRQLTLIKNFDMHYNVNRAVYNLEKCSSIAEMNNFIKNNRINIDKRDAGTGKTLLIYAVIRRQEKLVEYLINNKVDSAIKDKDGKSVVDYADEIKNEKIKEMIYSYVR